MSASSPQSNAAAADPRAAPRFAPHLGRAFLIWALTAAALFVGYEIFERLQLEEAPAQTREVWHLVRGLLVSLVTTLVTAIYLLQRAAPALRWGLDAAGSTRREATSDSRQALATWLLGLRWAAAAALCAVVAFATLSSGRVADSSVPRLWLGVGVLLAFNAALTVAGPRRLSSQRALGLQIAGDVLLLAWLVHHAGGMLNPFASFFVFHAVIAAIVLEAPRARSVAFGMAGFVLALTAAEVSGVLPPTCVGPNPTCEQDPLLLAAAGGAVITLVVGCALIVVTLVSRLQSERERLQSIIDCMGDAVVFTSPDASIKLRNQTAVRLWPNMDLKVCHAPEKWSAMLGKVSNPSAIEGHPLLKVSGRTYEATYAPVKDGAGALSGVVMVARDVTDRIEAQAWRMREERLAVVGKLAAALAHELNNPLGAIAVFTQHALKGIDRTHPLFDHLETVHRNANLCKKIVRDLLEYARQRPPERRPVDPRQLLGDVVRTVQPQAEQSGVKVETEIQAGLAESVLGDADQLRQVLVNLGLNAIEAMPGGGALRFGLAAQDSDRLRFEVRDTGPGISPAEQERIFTAFYTTKPQGTGLGLAVASDLVQAHGGTLELSSAVGQGSTFAVVLPSMRPAKGERG